MKLKSMSDIENEKKSKSKKKENTEMKTPKKTIIVTVLVTLLSVATIVGLLYTGFVLGQGYEKGINHEVTTQAKALATVVSKPDQQ